jgi:hypothetical protein
VRSAHAHADLTMLARLSLALAKRGRYRSPPRDSNPNFGSGNSLIREHRLRQA